MGWRIVEGEAKPLEPHGPWIRWEDVNPGAYVYDSTTNQWGIRSPGESCREFLMIGSRRSYIGGAVYCEAPNHWEFHAVPEGGSIVWQPFDATEQLVDDVNAVNGYLYRSGTGWVLCVKNPVTGIKVFWNPVTNEVTQIGCHRLRVPRRDVSLVFDPGEVDY